MQTILGSSGQIGRELATFLRRDHTADAYGQTWHLPCDDQRLTYRQFIALAAEVFGARNEYRVLKPWQLRLAGLLKGQIRDAAELFPRYTADNIFVSDSFKRRFPDFGVTSLRRGLEAMRGTLPA